MQFAGDVSRPTTIQSECHVQTWLANYIANYLSRTYLTSQGEEDKMSQVLAFQAAKCAVAIEAFKEEKNQHKTLFV